MPAFEHTLSVHLSDTDAAGIVFFSRVYDYAHNCYEEFLKNNGLAISKILQQGSYLLPIVHSSADYKAPMFLDQKIYIRLSLQELSTSSFVLDYQFLDESQRLLCRVKTIHVSISADSKQKISLPAKILELLKVLE